MPSPLLAIMERNSIWRTWSPRWDSCSWVPTVITATEAVSRDACQLEDDLVQSGALAGLRYEVVVRQGNVWEELEKIVRQEQVDL